MKHAPDYRRMLSRMGYYNYHNALINRHLDQEGGWDTHLTRCRNFIMKALEIYKPDRVTVLGSGWLLELPVAEIIEKEIEIRLIDIIHPPEVIRQAGALRKVELIEADLTGGLIESVWSEVRSHSFFNRLRTLEDIRIPEYRPDFDPGMVISLNLLTQLEYLLILFLRRKSQVSEVEISLFKSEIQQKHIDFLTRNRSVLITDVSEIITTKSGEGTTVPTLMTSLPSGDLNEEWTWDFHRTGSDYFNIKSTMNVVALSF